MIRHKVTRFLEMAFYRHPAMQENPDIHKVFDVNDPDYHSTGSSLWRRQLVKYTYVCDFCKKRHYNGAHLCICEGLAQTNLPGATRDQDRSTILGDTRGRLRDLEEKFEKFNSNL